MTEATRLAYAAARMQARYGAWPREATWAQLAHVGEFSHLLQAVRASALAPWVADLKAGSGAHRIERVLRQRFRTEVAELARWQPRPWVDTIGWFAWLPDLPAVAQIRQSRSVYAWMREDPVQAALAGTQPAGSGDVAALTRLADRADDDRPVSELWLDVWRERRPAGAGMMSRLERVLRQVLRPGTADAKCAAEPALRRMFRRHTREPAGTHAYVLLLYLQFVRLRGILLRARLFASPA